MNKAENSKCLLLNADYTPLKLISWQKAIVWSIKYKENPNYAIEIIEFYRDKYIQGSGDKKYLVPLVARTLKYFNIYNRLLKFSRQNLFIRDNYTCQYCGQKFPYKELTYDHIIPKSKFIDTKNSATSWKNITTACLYCNRKKSNKTPEQANMMLLNKPEKPAYSPKYLPISKELLTISKEMYLKWSKYIHNRNF
jgi:5-methylcytosine-specific restriction endonuclease McrA